MTTQSLQKTWTPSDTIKLNAVSMTLNVTLPNQKAISEISLPRLIQNVTGKQLPTRLSKETLVSYKSRCKRYFNVFTNRFITAELSHASGSGPVRVVDSFSSEPLVSAIYGARGFDSVDYTSNDKTGIARKETLTRSRQTKVVPITLIIDVIANAIARDEQARISLNEFASMKTGESANLELPVRFQEELNCVRKGNSGSIFITPTFVHLPKDFINACGLQKSALDTEYICTPLGISATIQFFTKLRLAQELAIPYTVIAVPSYLSGNTVTKPCLNQDPKAVVFISTEEEITYNDEGSSPLTVTVTHLAPNNATMQLCPGTAYGMSPNAVHIADMLSWSQRIYIDGVHTDFSTSSPAFCPNNHYDTVVEFIINRVFGVITNSPYVKPSNPDRKDPPTGPKQGKDFKRHTQRVAPRPPSTPVDVKNNASRQDYIPKDINLKFKNLQREFLNLTRLFNNLSLNGENHSKNNSLRYAPS